VVTAACFPCCRRAMGCGLQPGIPRALCPMGANAIKARAREASR
jgi:hypothetical protein